MGKMTCEVYLSTHPVGYSGSPSTVNETNCNKKSHLKISYELHQFHSDLSHHIALEKGCHLQYCCREWVLQLARLNRGGDGFWRDSSSKIGRSLIDPFLPDLFKMRYLGIF